MTIRTRTRTSVAVVAVIAGAVLGASCFTSPEEQTTPVVTLTREQQQDSVGAWFDTLPYPFCPVAVGQVAYFEPLERVIGAIVTFRKGTKKFTTTTNRNGQFRVVIDTGRLTLTVVHRGITIFNDSVYEPYTHDHASPRFMLMATRDGKGWYITETSGCERPPGWADTLISEPKR